MSPLFWKRHQRNLAECYMKRRSGRTPQKTYPSSRPGFEMDLKQASLTLQVVTVLAGKVHRGVDRFADLMWAYTTIQSPPPIAIHAENPKTRRPFFSS